MKTVHDLRLEMPRGQLVMALALASETKSLALDVKPLVLILLTIVPL